MRQPVAALAIANDVRRDGAAVRREIKAGHLSVAEALADPRAGVLLVLLLVLSRPRTGRVMAEHILHCYRISHSRRVRDLTARQRDALAADRRLA